MAEHVAGTTMVVARVLAAENGGVFGGMIIISERRGVMTMLCLPRGGLPPKGRGEHSRQQNGEQY